MKTKDKKQQKLLNKFASVAAAVIAAHGFTNAQVVLSVPDTTLKLSGSLSAFNIDLNNDDSVDLKLQIKTSHFTSISTTQTAGGAYKSYKVKYYYINYGVLFTNTKNGFLATKSNNYARPLSTKFKMLDTLKFKSKGDASNIYIFKRTYNTKSKTTNTTYYGYFRRDTVHYLGIKFYDTAGVGHLGWMAIKLNGDSSITVLKFAYEKSADSIYIGTKPLSLGVVDSSSSGATIAVQPKFNGKIYYVVIDSSQSLPNAEQVINGTDGDGNPAVVAGVDTVTTAPDTSLISVSGLNPSTKYRFCMVVADEYGHADIDVDSISFVTLSGTVTQIEPVPPVRIYPNPAHNFVNLQGLPQGCKVEIFDLNGRKVLERTNFASGKLNISQLNPGVYSIKISAPKFILTKKLIKY